MFILFFRLFTWLLLPAHTAAHHDVKLTKLNVYLFFFSAFFSPVGDVTASESAELATRENREAWRKCHLKLAAKIVVVCILRLYRLLFLASKSSEHAVEVFS